MLITVYSIVYLLSALTAFLVGFLALQRRAVVGARELFFLALFTAIDSYMCFFEASATSQELKVLFAKLAYIGGVFIPVFYLLFVLRFTKMLRFRDIKSLWLLFVFPLITLVLTFTNEFHSLIWSSFSSIDPETNLMFYGHGFWFWVGYTIYSYVVFAIATYYLFAFILRNRNKKTFRKQGWIVTAGGVSPWLASLCYITGFTPFPGLDLAPIFTALSAVLFTEALLHSSFLSLIPVAREKLVETLPIGVLALDGEDRIQDINFEARNLLNVTHTDVLGMTPAQAGVQPATLLEALLAHEVSTQTHTNDHRGFRSLRIDKQTLPTLKGSRLLTIHDTTGQVLREMELTEAKSKAEESDKLKSAFLANMSHEIRTPMNCILGFTSVLQRSELSDTERGEYVDIIRRNCDRLLGTLNDLVDMSKVECGQMTVNLTEFDVNEILITMYDLFKPEADAKGLRFERCEMVPYGESLIRSDKNKLYSILTNLIKNALKYTRSGFVRYDCFLNDEELCLKVSDSGIGIAPEKHSIIFERFVQVDSSRERVYEGAGLGLAITKAFVDMLQGTIILESSLNNGSTFTVRIPVQRLTCEALMR